MQDTLEILVNREHAALLEDAAREFGVSPTVHHMDFMYRFIMGKIPEPDKGIRYYFRTGDDCARRLHEIAAGHGFDCNRPLRLLDFASGYARVTRHLKRYFPQATISCCDSHQTAVRFCSALGYNVIQSDRDPDRVWLGGPFDLTCAMSFFSHMPKRTFGRWIASLVNAMAAGGLFAFTTHGPTYLDALNAEQLQSCMAQGHFFVPTSEQQDLDPCDYGTAYVTPEYTRECLRSTGAPLEVSYEPAGWFGQDLYVVRRA